MRQPDGATLREHLQSGYRQTGRKPPGLDGPACPPELEYLWHWFCEISNRRTRGMSASPLTWQDIAGWQTVRGLRLSAFERDCIEALDAELLKDRAHRDPDQRQK